MSASKNLGKVFMTPKGIWDKTLNYTKLDIVTNKVGKISCGYIATTDIEKNIEITDNRWLKLFELLDGDLTEEYKAVQTDVTNKATDVDTNKKAVDLIYSQMQKLYDVEISTTTPTNERTGLWINPDDISGVINIPEIKDDEVSDADTWSSKKIDNVTNSLKEDISTKITKFYASSQGETNLADSDNGKIQDMMLYGKSEQKRYSGKNLLNATLQTTIVNGVTCTANGDGTYTLNGTATTTTTFDIAQDVSCSSFRLVGCPVGGAHDASYELQARTNNLIYGYDTGDGKNIKADENFFIRIRINTGINCNNLLFKPMIVDAEKYPDITYDDFEPYVGGQPSPSPDYPQEIKSVVKPRVKVCGKNLIGKLMPGVIAFNTGNYVSGGTKYASTDFIPVKPGEKYTISNATTGGERWYYNSDKKSVIGMPKGSIIVTIPENIAYMRVSCNTENKDKFQIELGATATAYQPYTESTATLPYTLNAIPVSSGGNVTIDGQQYIADYVDVERGKLVRMVEKKVLNGTENWNLSERSENRNGVFQFFADANIAGALCDKAIYESLTSHYGTFDTWYNQIRFYAHTDEMTVEEWRNFLSSNNHVIYIVRNTPVKTDLTKEEITAFKALATYYPTTNISVNSEQLDGYTVFNYPISMENGWNYVKQQIGDTREYIYDMDARAQDTDLQAAEAYVNSEYAVALTELEV